MRPFLEARLRTLCTKILDRAHGEYLIGVIGHRNPAGPSMNLRLFDVESEAHRKLTGVDV